MRTVTLAVRDPLRMQSYRLELHLIAYNHACHQIPRFIQPEHSARVLVQVLLLSIGNDGPCRLAISYDNLG